jgi:hypothetical protein
MRRPAPQAVHLESRLCELCGSAFNVVSLVGFYFFAVRSSWNFSTRYRI